MKKIVRDKMSNYDKYFFNLPHAQS